MRIHTKNTRTSLGIAVPAALALFGTSVLCSEGIKRPIVGDDGPSSLVITAAIPGRVSGELRSGSRVVTFEAVRGPATDPDILRTDPTAPPYLVDVRCMDANGPFLVGIAGHEPLEPWFQDAATDSPVSERDESFRLAARLPRLLTAAIDDPRLQPELVAIDMLASMVTETDLTYAPRDLLISARKMGNDATTYFQHIVEIRRKPTAIIAEHSAVKVKSYNMSTCALVGVWATSNHGTSAADGSMTLKCSKSFNYRTNIKPPIFDNACTTPYGFLPGQHVCNDDSLAEYTNVKNNYTTSNPTCSDGTLRMYAPSCY